MPRVSIPVDELVAGLDWASMDQTAIFTLDELLELARTIAAAKQGVPAGSATFNRPNAEKALLQRIRDDFDREIPLPEGVLDVGMRIRGWSSRWSDSVLTNAKRRGGGREGLLAAWKARSDNKEALGDELLLGANDLAELDAMIAEGVRPRLAIYELARAGNADFVARLGPLYPKLEEKSGYYGPDVDIWEAASTPDVVKVLSQLLPIKKRFREWRNSPLFNKKCAKNPELCEALLQAGWNANEDDAGIMPIHRAVSAEVVSILVRYGANVHQQTYQGNTPLHLAENLGIARVLIAAGASTTILNDMGQTPMEGNQYAKLAFDEMTLEKGVASAKTVEVPECPKCGKVHEGRCRM